MKETDRITPIHSKVFDKRVAENIARETGAPIDLATRTYKEELNRIAEGARITQYVNVLASRRARMKLRKHHDHHGAA